MKIGFIGLGIMGRPMAKNLIKAGHELFVCDFNKDHVADLVSCGAKSAANGAEMAKEVDVIITMVQNSPQVRAAVLGENGVAETAKPGFTLIDMSSIDPVESRKIGEELAKKGCKMLDAPVSGGEPKAIDGTLSVMVGGARQVPSCSQGYGRFCNICWRAWCWKHRKACKPDRRSMQHRSCCGGSYIQ